MRLFGWIRSWRESTRKLSLLGAEINERIHDLAAPLRGGASDTQVAASIQSLNNAVDTIKMQGMVTTVGRKK